MVIYTPSMTDMIRSMFPLTEASLTALKNLKDTAAAPLKGIAEHILHINGLYLKEKGVSDEISKLSKRSRSLHDDIDRKIRIVSNDVQSVELKDRMVAALLTMNWEFLTVGNTIPKVDNMVRYIKKYFASHDKLFKQEMESIGQTIGIDVKPIIKTLKDRNVLILKKSYICPECGSTMLPSDGRGIECDDCNEEFDSKRDLDREIWYEKGPNFYVSPPVAKPVSVPPSSDVKPEDISSSDKPDVASKEAGDLKND